MGDGLFTLDTDGLLTYMNAAAERLLGWRARSSRGARSTTSRARTPGRPSEAWPILNARRTGDRARIDDVFVRRDGRELPVAYTSAPFETDDGVHGCVVVFEDISERKAHEQDLEREVEKLAWIGRIQEALAEDRFVLYAQPIVDVAAATLVQHELLLRLRERDGDDRRARRRSSRSPRSTA